MPSLCATLSREVWQPGGGWWSETSSEEKGAGVVLPGSGVEKHPSTNHEYLVSRGI
ncbi:hypothetical protein K0M31_008389 [Melipona bicolor]|uniref:Uncharacterized protein n=1 Tax=Melipona bicolor TaxID=60889 RepID=A0AA40FR78_9HYME|nr:hypothetical protein K0M31_008389 [Melipona bicolor]